MAAYKCGNSWEQVIHTYMHTCIDHYNPSVRTMGLLSSTTYVLIFYLSRGPYSLKSTSNDRLFFWETLRGTILFTLRVLARNLLRESCRRNNLIRCLIVALRLIRQRTTYYTTVTFCWIAVIIRTYGLSTILRSELLVSETKQLNHVRPLYLTQDLLYLWWFLFCKEDVTLLHGPLKKLPASPVIM